MRQWSNAAKVGAMTIALCAALYLGYRYISPEAGTEGGYRVWAYVPDVSGVAPRSRVTVQGVQVGVVERIWLDQGKARVDVRMKPEVKLYEDAAIGKRASSLIGEFFIVLTPGTEQAGKELGDNDQITHLLEDASLQKLQEQLSEILKDVKSVTETLRETVGSETGQQQIADILKNVADVTEQVALAVRENRESVRDALANIRGITGQAQPEIAEILKNVRQVTEDVRDLLAKAKVPEEESGELRSALERVNRASASLESVLEHADNIAARIDEGKGTVGRLTKDETLINEVETVVEGVGDYVGGLNRLQTIVGLRTDYNFLANTVKSYVQLRLQPAEDKYYLIEVVNDPRGRTTFEQVDVDTTNPNDPPHYREIRTVTTNAFRFSVQIAKRMGPFTGRFGIRESTGGIGLDFHLLDDRFELQQDLFGFGEELSMRWRLSLSYEFISKLWLLGGIDNILNDDRRDYFVGLQLRFNDQDLKTILPFAPTGM